VRITLSKAMRRESGLLKPKKRTSSGYRLYRLKDLEDANWMMRSAELSKRQRELFAAFTGNDPLK